MSVVRTCSAEFLGTALLVIAGVGTAVLAGDQVGDVGVAVAFGLSLLALVYALGPISGAHLNPAVTLGMLVARRIAPARAAGYVAAQVLGGLAGAAVVAAIAAGRPAAVDGLGANGYGSSSTDGYGLGPVLLTEVVLTFTLVFVVLSVTTTTADTAFAGVSIGLTLTVLHLVAIPIDGTSVNPARSIGPALLTGGTALTQLWVFLVAPLAGGLLAALVHRSVFRPVPAVAA